MNRAEYYRRYKEKNRESIRRNQRRWYLENKEKARKSTEKYVASGKAAETYKARIERDPDKYRKRALDRAYKCKASDIDRYRRNQRRYQSGRRQLGGRLEDAGALNRVYDACPMGLEVDHIIPLKHEDICGLHVSWNLQYLSRRDNARKSNNFDGTYDNEGWQE